VLICPRLLANDRNFMGSHDNGRAFNIFAWTTVVVVALLTVDHDAGYGPGRSYQ
jgi:Mn2+/Fe2+ NRAMP family transporter